MFVIDVEFLRGVYEAGGQADDLAPEWPPHPARLFNALVASADHDEPSEIEALRWLESAAPPMIRACQNSVECGGRSSYVPTNQLGSGSYGRFAGRKGLGPRSWRAVSPEIPRVSFCWSDEPDEQVGAVLASLASRVPYLGRSTCPVATQAAFSDSDLAANDGRSTLVADADELLGLTVELPRPGYLDDLTQAHAEGIQPHTVWRALASYRVDHAQEPVAVHPASAYQEMVVVGFDGNRRFTQDQLVLVTSRLREAIESHVDGGPLALRGHRPGDTGKLKHQVAIVGLPDVGFTHATGRILGLGIVFPRDVEDQDRSTVLRGLAGVVREGLRLGRLGEVRLDPTPRSATALRDSRWTGPSSLWVSATPVSANRHHRRFDHALLEADLADSLRHLELPDPIEISISRGPIISGAERLDPRVRVRHAKDAATQSFHAVVRFAEPVSGPIVLGSMRRYGLGLMLPTTDGNTGAV